MVRILSPPKNMALVHRWMANKKMCNVMHANERTDLEDPELYEIDMDENFRCPFEADGNNNKFYDIGSDYLVMQVRRLSVHQKRLRMTMKMVIASEMRIHLIQLTLLQRAWFITIEAMALVTEQILQTMILVGQITSLIIPQLQL